MTESTLKGPVGDTKGHIWLPRLVGILLAVLFIVANMIPIFQFPPLMLPMWVVIAAVIATAFFWKGNSGVIVVRWWAKIASVVMGALLTTMFISEMIGGHEPPPWTIQGVVSFTPWLVVFAGIIVSFFREDIGGILMIIGAIILQTEVFVLFHDRMVNPVILEFAVFGLGILYCWWRTRQLSRALPATP